ncbi:MAG: aldose 1-epimerase family protein [Muribaculaceae bacterium]|nr:aldose 1-epimerase family protein [Muribaculaceae bacterium]
MRYELENGTLRAEIDDHGAEIKSIRRLDTMQEYMWHGDPAYWGRTSPVLFPFVGSLRNKEFLYKGKHYPMGQHGFARDMDFELETREDSQIWFVLRSNAKTLEKYPFPFVLHIGYELKDTCVKVLWRVENPADTPMHFSIGAHPAFLCPIHGEPDKSGYQLYFGENINELHHHGNDTASGLALKEDLVLPLHNHCAAITPEFFDRCTYMVENSQTGVVGLNDPDGKRIVTMEFDAPLFALWSPEGKNAPFLCIEPWYGRCDAEDFSGSLKEREYNNCLQGGGCFEAEYKMIF